MYLNERANFIHAFGQSASIALDDSMNKEVLYDHFSQGPDETSRVVQDKRQVPRQLLDAANMPLREGRKIAVNKRTLASVSRQNQVDEELKQCVYSEAGNQTTQIANLRNVILNEGSMTAESLFGQEGNST